MSEKKSSFISILMQWNPKVCWIHLFDSCTAYDKKKKIQCLLKIILDSSYKKNHHMLQRLNLQITFKTAKFRVRKIQGYLMYIKKISLSR